MSLSLSSNGLLLTLLVVVLGVTVALFDQQIHSDHPSDQVIQLKSASDESLQLALELAPEERVDEQAIDLSAWQEQNLLSFLKTQELGHEQWLQVVNAALKKGRLSEAQEVLEVLSAQHKNWSALEFYQGRLASAQGRDLDAIAAYEQTLALEPSHSAAAYNLALKRYHLDQLDLALIDFQRAASLSGGKNRARVYWQLARVQKNLQQFENAQQSLQVAIDFRPNFPEAWLMLAQVLRRDPAQLEQAEQHIVKALNLRPDYKAALSEFAEITQDQGRNVEAIAYYQKALELSAQDTEIRHDYATFLASIGRYQQALSQYQQLQLAELNTQTAQYYQLYVAILSRQIEQFTQLYNAIHHNLSSGQKLNIAKLLRRKHIDEQASKIYKELITEDLTDKQRIHSHTALALLAMDRGDYPKAAQQLSKIQEGVETHASYWFAQARLLTGLETPDIAAAIEAYERALSLNPKYRSARINLALLHKRQGQFQKALALYDEVLLDSPRYSPVLFNRALILNDLARQDDARDQYQDLLALQPDHQGAKLNLAALERRAGNKKRAKVLLEELLAESPKHQSGRFNYALLLKSQKEYVQAAREFHRLVELYPNHARGWQQLAEVEAKRKRYLASARAYDKAISLGFSDASILFNIAQKLSRKQRHKEAEKVYQLLLNHRPDYTNARVNLGVAQRRQGDIQKAMISFQQVLTIDPNQLSALYNLGLCQRDLELWSKAYSSFKKVILLDSKHYKSWRQIAKLDEREKEFEQALTSYRNARSFGDKSRSTAKKIHQLKLRLKNTESKTAS